MSIGKYKNLPCILLTGGTGYLGALVAEVLLKQQEYNVIALVRETVDREKFLEPIHLEAKSKAQPLSEEQLGRLKLLPFLGIDKIQTLESELKSYNIEEIVHCAGCVDYFDTQQLDYVNVQFTRNLLGLASQLNVQRFTYLSTAYSAGYIEGSIPEALHSEPAEDPTEYTRSKRDAEWVIANSDIPYLIIRPSVVIGDSQTGRYGGKRYGLYQQWMGLERLLCDRYHEELHVIAPRQPINFIHQNAFQNAFEYAFRFLKENTIIHFTSSLDACPTMRDLWELWLDRVMQPRNVIYYDRLKDIPLDDIHPRLRAYLMFAEVNLEIASHYWAFDKKGLQALQDKGLYFPDATLETLTLCQNRFVSSSSRVQQYIKKYHQQLSYKHNTAIPSDSCV